MNDETIDERNSLRDFIKYDFGSNFYVSLDDIVDVKRKRKELEDTHNVKRNSVWD